MTNYTITLTETENLAIRYIAVSPQGWIDTAIHARALEAIDEIVKLYVDYALANNLSIPSTKEQIILAAYSSGIIKTAEERNTEIINNV